MRVKLTDLTIQHLKYQHPQVTYWDTLLPAFGVRVGSRSKTFIVMQGKTRKRQTIGRYPDTKLQDARDKARLFLTSETAAPGASGTAAEAVEEYLRALSTRRRTAVDYERLLKRHFASALGHRQLSEITPQDILAITDRLRSTPTECRNAHRAMNTFFAWAVPRRLSTSPMSGLKTPTKPNKRDRILSEAELKAVWDHVDGPLEPIVRICILTGMRRSEVASIQASWFTNEELVIPAAIAKNHREHRLPITPMLRPFLERAPFRSFNWARMKNALDIQSGVSGYVLHDLRRTAASMMAAPPISAPPHLIERILNHVTGSGTALQHVYQRYTYEAEIRDIFERYHKHLASFLTCSI